jgi:hypothetical protein
MMPQFWDVTSAASALIPAHGRIHFGLPRLVLSQQAEVSADTSILRGALFFTGS